MFTAAALRPDQPPYHQHIIKVAAWVARSKQLSRCTHVIDTYLSASFVARICVRNASPRDRLQQNE